MATTPPPTRQRTPPTPLHGSKYDTAEPYSPRRSTRITKTGRYNPYPNRAVSPPPFSAPPANKSVRSTPRKSSAQHASSINFSPPPSPGASDDQPFGESYRPTGMLPTPAKTPRKRALSGDVKIDATARVLFSNRPANAGDAMPTPRRSRKGRKHTAFTLSSLDEENDGGSNIAIYTDSNDRVPEVDEAEDNPFMVQKGRRGRARAGRGPGAIQSSASGTKYGLSKEVDEAVDRGEGIVYVFRGKKIFRKFDSNDHESNAESESQALSDLELRHRAGHATKERLSRSSLQPRQLFPPKEASPGPDDADEEALTDIEATSPEATLLDPGHVTMTPMKQQRFTGALTPPTTGRKTRNRMTPTSSPPLMGPRRGSPFDGWQRTKPLLGVSSTTKRPGESMEGVPSSGGKRTRSGQHLFG